MVNAAADTRRIVLVHVVTIFPYVTIILSHFSISLRLELAAMYFRPHARKLHVPKPLSQSVVAPAPEKERSRVCWLGAASAQECISVPTRANSV